MNVQRKIFATRELESKDNFADCAFIYRDIANPGSSIVDNLYNSIIRKLGISGIFVSGSTYVLARDYLETRKDRVSGFTVSMPYKSRIMPLCDRITRSAKRIGAVNTVYFDGNDTVGGNTDWTGALESIKEIRDPKGAKTLLIGAGGAARAVAYALQFGRAKTTICNRTHSKAVDLAEAFGADARRLSELTSLREFDIVINATSIGFAGNDDPEECPPIDTMRSGSLFMDLPFDPEETVLSRVASASGATCIEGNRVLACQALRQFALWGHDVEIGVDAILKSVPKMVDVN